MNNHVLRAVWDRPAKFLLMGAVACAQSVSIAQTNSNSASVKLPPPAPRRPGIVLIIADNIGYGDLGCYGQTRITTPNLDKLAAGGMRFTSYYAGSPEDGPSRAALMTGMEPRHLHAGFNQVLPPDALTLADVLRQQGFRTGLIGEWNLGDTSPLTPNQKGFDEFAGFLTQNHAREYYSDRIHRHDPVKGDAEMIFIENEQGKRGLFLPDALGDWAANFLQINKPQPYNHYRPFFLCLSYPTPHWSPEAPPPSDARHADQPWPPSQRNRATLISHMDDSIGKFLDKLAAYKMNTNTIVIFTSIGGPQMDKQLDPEFFNSTGPLRGTQGGPFEGGLRVPMIIRWPAKIKPGTVSDLAWSAWDLLPTVAELAITKPPEKLDGISIAPALLGKKQKKQHELLQWTTAESGALAARMGDWKILKTNSAAAFELYNLRDDPGEKQNLAAKNPDQLAKIQKAVEAAK